MSIKAVCTGKNEDDCNECQRWYSAHSLHYDAVYNKKVSEITCSIGGHKVFDEDGYEV